MLRKIKKHAFRMSIDPIIEKLRRLIRLSESSNRYEGRLAMLRAIELAKKHGIDLQRIFTEEADLGSSTFQQPEPDAADTQYFYRYVEMLTKAEDTAERLGNTNAELLMASSKQPNLRFNEEWKHSVRTIAETMLSLPSLILDHEPPSGLTTFYALYQQWGTLYSQRARCLLDAVRHLDAFDLSSFRNAMNEFANQSETIAAVSNARATYIRSAFPDQATI